MTAERSGQPSPESLGDSTSLIPSPSSMPQAELPFTQKLLGFEAVLGAGLTAVVGGAFAGLQGGSQIAASQLGLIVDAGMAHGNALRIARQTAVTLSRVDAFRQLVDHLQQDGIIEVPSDCDQGQLFDLVTNALEGIIQANVLAAAVRYNAAVAGKATTTAEADLAITGVETAARRFAVYPRVAVYELLKLPASILGNIITDLTKWVGEGGKEIIISTGKLVGGITGIAISFPHAAIGWGAEFLPDAAIPVPFGLFAGALIFAYSAFDQGHTVSSEVFWQSTATGGFMGTLAGVMVTLLISRFTRPKQ